MNCRHVSQWLSGYLEGVLPTREAQAVTAHLEDCSACRRLHERFLAIGAELRAWEEPLPPLHVERDIADRWFAEIAARQPAPAPTREGRTVRIGRLAPGLSLLAAGLLVLLGFALGPRYSGRTGGPEPLRPGEWRPQQRAALPPDSDQPHVSRQLSPSEPPVSRPPKPGSAGDPEPSSPGRKASRFRQNVGSPGPDSPAGIRTTAASPGGDLRYWNPHPVEQALRWTRLPGDAWGRIEASVRQNVPVRDDFVTISFPRVAANADRATVIAVERYQREAAITDARLTREVTLQLKAMALSDVCERLTADSGIDLRAGPSVADEKVTVFCEKLPLREVMRQLSRPFGYTWLRSGKASEYRYELVQDLRSQLLEEELRNRDRNAALLALDGEMERYRNYRDLSPDEVVARARTAPPGEKKLLENLSKYGWGPIQMYFRLSPQDLAALRVGQTLTFSADPQPGEQPLPPEVARGVLQSLRDWRVGNRDGRFRVGNDKEIPDGLPLLSVPEAQAMVTLRIDPSELGQFSLDGGSGIRITSPGQSTNPSTSVTLAVGTSPAARDRGTGAASARFASDPALRPRHSIRPHSSCQTAPSPGTATGTEGQSRTPVAPVSEPRVTSADVMEALHQATRLPIVADYYTRLYPRSAVSVNNEPLQVVLNQLAAAMRLRWNKEGQWLQFRSVSYYDDRLKEVPNRLLARWAASRRQHGALALDDLIEIARLSDVQLDSKLVAEGIKECFGLPEWDLARRGDFRPHLRYLGELTPSQRQEVMSPAGLQFTRMSLAQQQQFMNRLGPQIGSLEQLASALLRSEYTQPGWFRWDRPAEPTVSPVLERTREAALQAARRIDPQADAAQIMSSELAMTVLYTWGSPELGGGSLAMRVTPHYTRRRTDSFQAQSPERQSLSGH